MSQSLSAFQKKSFDPREKQANKMSRKLKDIIAEADLCIQEIDNTEDGWKNQGQRIIQAAKEHEKILVIVNIGDNPTAQIEAQDIEPRGTGVEYEETEQEELLTDTSNTEKPLSEAPLVREPTDIVLNLQYFFPYCDQALRENQNARIALVVLCSNENDPWRVRRYLGVMNAVKSKLTIWIANVPNDAAAEETEVIYAKYDNKDIKALFPLLCIGQRTAVNPDRVYEDENDLTTDILAKETDVFSRYLNGEYILDGGTQYKALLTAGFSAIEAITEFFTKNALLRVENNEKSLVEKQKELDAIEQNSNSNPADKWDVITKIERAEKQLQNNKEKLCQCEQYSLEFWDILNGNATEVKRLDSLPLFTQIVWLCTLRTMLEQEELTEWSPPSLQRSRIDLTLWDSIAYSEGILQLLENSELHSQHHCGYLSVYFHQIGLRQISKMKDATNRRLRLFYRYRSKKNESFEQLSESVYLEFNITDMGRTGDGQARGIENLSGRKLSELFLGEGLEKDPQNVANHYGLPVFFRTVQRKKGRFICMTPYDVDRAVWIHSKEIDKGKKESEKQRIKEQYENTAQVFTSYLILLPVTTKTQNETISTGHSDLFDATFLKNQIKPSRYKSLIINVDDLPLPRATAITADEKICAVKRVNQAFNNIVLGADPCSTVFVLRMTACKRPQDMEICLKGLFLLIAEHSDNKEEHLLFRLVFCDEYALSEAVRRFAIFYDRAGKSKWIGGAQIAFCETCPSETVRLILAGKDISTAYVTAKQYMHYNIDRSSGYLLSQIEYLVNEETGEREQVAQPVFPFDLVKSQNVGESDFERKITGFLETNLTDEGYGCKIPNAHIRLGSKIHLRDFYDGELLFQSISNTYRFAYLIAERILEKEQHGNEPYCLIGYENYASVLVHEVRRLLMKVLEQAIPGVIHLQYIKSGEDEERIIELEEARNAAAQSYLRNGKARFVIILPVATTLSTIYKIKNTFLRKYRVPILESSQNYALIVVGNSGDQSISKKYWIIQDNGDGHALLLEPENSDEPASTKAQWFFMPKTEWYLPDACALCGTEKIDMSEEYAENGDSNGNHTDWSRIPLTQVDKTSTLPKLIFPTSAFTKKHGIDFTIRDGNEQRIKQLQGCVEYGHIQRGTNHYQFYIDYEKYYQEARENCKKWLKSLRNTIDSNAFNIIVSPLQYDNGLFVKDVIDELFQSSLRFIYISLHQTYREEMRSRFSFIVKEYQDACSGATIPQYNIYYVDYSVVSGMSLLRGKTLIKTLMNDMRGQVNIHLYEKVILLTNRSSLDTASSFVNHPESDFLAFSTLCIPSYNTMNAHCPACEMDELYLSIAKYCATNRLYWHYRDIGYKHRLKSLEAHRQETEAMHNTKQRYLSSFYQGLCNELDKEFIEVDDYLNGQAQLAVKGASNRARTKRQYQDQIFKNVKNNVTLILGECNQSRMTLADIRAKAKNKNKKPISVGQMELTVTDAIDLYYKALIDGRNWRRLLCTHQAVMLSSEEGCGAKEILEIIVSKVCSVKTQYEKREWLISYIKVFSRGYPAKIAPVRAGIYTLMELMFIQLLSDPDKPYPEWEKLLGRELDDRSQKLLELLSVKHASSKEYLQMYQLYLTLAKRMCDLQSNLLLQYDTLEKIKTFVSRLRDGVKDRADSAWHDSLLALPEDAIEADYLYMVKWATMSSSEQVKAFFLQKLSSDIEKKDMDGVDSGKTTEVERQLFEGQRFFEVIRQENTRVIYSGIRRLSETMRDSGYHWDKLTKHVSNELKNGGIIQSSDTRSVLDMLNDSSFQNPLHDLFRFLSKDLALNGAEANIEYEQVQNLLAALLGIYRLMQSIDNKEEMEQKKDYIQVYAALCFFLRKLGGYDNCCLVHESNDDYTIIAEHLERPEQDVHQTVKSIINACEKSTKEDGKLYNTVWEATDEDYPGQALVLTLRIRRKVDITYHQKVFLVLFDQRGQETNEENRNKPRRSHYLLFMRQQIQAALERDLYALYHFKFGRDDVVRLNSSARKLCILHLTDLHISTKNKEAILKLIGEKQDELKKGKPELMVVTGDVVQGNGSGTDLEDNYKCAEEILTRIAETIWIEKNQYNGREELCADWRKRIIIIPGNHDYASMNELVASSSLRATTMGTPSHHDGSPMSKYTYYIQFLQNFLGIDTKRSIKNNLNELIEYHTSGFRLRFIALNSIAEVGTLRNNKVQLDKGFIERLSELNKKDNLLNICLSHHTCCYKPDYFYDRYYVPKMEKASVKVAKRIIESCDKERRMLISATSKPETGRLNAKEVRRIIESGKQRITALEKRNDTAFHELSKTFVDSELYQDVRYLTEHWWELTNERCMQIITTFHLNKKMSTTDWKHYRERMETLNKIYPFALMLGGHTHRAGWTDELTHGAVDVDTLIGKCACIEGSRFYAAEEKTCLCFGKLFVTDEEKCRTVSYEFYPRDKAIVILKNTHL